MPIWTLFRRKGSRVGGVWLSYEQQAILATLFAGGSLRSHRDLEGNKRYELLVDSADATVPQLVSRKSVLGLRDARLLETNHKFPAATFLMTGRGNQIAAELSQRPSSNPVMSNQFIRD